MGLEIQFSGVSQRYEATDETSSVDALRAVDLVIEAGSFAVLMGASGSGKSTLLNLAGCIDRPSAGRIHVGPYEVTSMSERELTLLRRKKIGFIFQAFHLVPTLDVEENIAFPLSVAGEARGVVRQRVAEALKEIGLENRAKHFPNQLSGGEMQRVAIARAIIHRPELILADEPTGNLDSKTGERILALIAEVQRTYSPTIVMATHSDHAASFGDYIVRVADGQVGEKVSSS